MHICDLDHSKYAQKWAEKAINVYSSQGTFNELKLKGHRYKVIKAMEWVSVGEFKVYPFPAIHDTSESYGYIIDTPSGERVLYSIDTKGVTYSISGVSIMLTECNFCENILRDNMNKGILSQSLALRIYENHKSLQKLLWELNRMDKSKLRQIYLLHLSDRNSDEKLFKNEVQKATGCEVYVL